MNEDLKEIQTESTGEVEEIVDTPIDENLTGIDRIKNILDKNCINYDIDKVTESYTEYSTHGKLELAKDKRELKNMVELIPILEEMVNNYHTVSDNAENMIKPVDLLTKMADNAEDQLHDDTTEVENSATKNVLDTIKSKTKEAEEDEDSASIEDIEKMILDIKNDVAINSVILNECIGAYNESHGKTSIYDDIVEKLKKDRQTIQSGTDINAALKLKNIDKALDSIENIGENKYDQYKMMIPKVQNIKNLKSLIKEIRNPKKANLNAKVGFIDEYIDIFTSFFVEETEFRNIYYLEDWDMSTSAEVSFSYVCRLFAYHLAKVIESERKHQNYKAILFKLIFFNIVNIQQSYPMKKNQIGRFVDDDREKQTDISMIRSYFYDEYMQILNQYFIAYGFK